MPLPMEKRYTYADLLSWDGPERYELIDGVLYMMSPPSRIHQKISMEIGRQISNYLTGKTCEVYSSPFAVRLFETKQDNYNFSSTVVEPDICIYCDPEKLDDKGGKGAPDMALEIVSPSSVKRDYLEKHKLYQRAGVKEYWIVEPKGKQVFVYLLSDGRFDLKDVCTESDVVKVNVLDNCFVDLSRVFAE